MSIISEENPKAKLAACYRNMLSYNVTETLILRANEMRQLWQFSRLNLHFFTPIWYPEYGSPSWFRNFVKTLCEFQTRRGGRGIKQPKAIWQSRRYRGKSAASREPGSIAIFHLRSWILTRRYWVFRMANGSARLMTLGIPLEVPSVELEFFIGRVDDELT